MKKFVLFSILCLSLAAGNLAQAQYSDLYYHRTGDTIEWKSEIGYYAWWEFKPFFENNLTMTITDLGTNLLSELDSVVVLMRFYTPTPLKIIGIAGTGIRERFDNTTGSYIPDTNCFQDYYYLYDAGSSGLTQLAQIPWSPFNPGRTLHINTHDPNPGVLGITYPDSCCWYYPKEYYLPIHEYYFDTAIYVTDSFYVGGSYFGNVCTWGTGIPSSDSIHTHYFYAMTTANRIVCDQNLQDPYVYDYARSCYPRGVHLKYKRGNALWWGGAMDSASFDDVPWTDAERGAWGGYVMLVYPIVEVDTTVPPVSFCPPVANVQVVVSDTSATVTWDDFPNYTSVELSYGPCNIPQNQWQTVEVYDNSLYTLTGLDWSSCYKVSVRALCDTSKKTSGWSSPVTFYTPSDTTSGGGDTVSIGGEPTTLSQLTFLVPNPAHSEIVVSSGFNLQEIDIWTVGGVWVHHQTTCGHRVTVPIDFLRPGTYIVAIRTHEGTTHKKLIVQ